MSKSFWEVIVGNVGKVHEGDDERLARVTYSAYVEMSKKNVGRVAGESVSLWCDNEPIAEHEADGFELP